MGDFINKNKVMSITQNIIHEMINKKADENNTIDLNAYTIGIEEALNKIDIDNISKTLHRVKGFMSGVESFSTLDLSEPLKDIESLINRIKA